MEFKIEKGIPLPTKGRWNQLAEKMEDGDSVLLSLQDSINLKEHLEIYMQEKENLVVWQGRSLHIVLEFGNEKLINLKRRFHNGI